MLRRRLPDFERLWDIVQKCLFLPLVVVILILLLAWSIDSVRAWLQAHGLRGFDVPAAVGIALAATMFVLYSFQQQLRQMGKQISAFSPPPSSNIIHGGIARVYEKFPAILSEFRPGSDSDKTLDVLGLTVFTAWPMLLEPLLSSSLRGWRVNVFFLSPDFIKKNTYFSPQWARDAETQLAAINEFTLKYEPLEGTLHRAQRGPIQLLPQMCIRDSDVTTPGRFP